MVHAYGAKETKAFCCNCKKVTVHKYEAFRNQSQKKKKKVSFLRFLRL